MTEDFRVTFFFGPDEDAAHPETTTCVFNVKKRSWKGGVQVAVELAEAQLKRLRERGQLDELVEMIRAKVEAEAFADYQRRTRDLFVQHLCRMKLDLVIERGIVQDNQTISAETMVAELDREAAERADEIQQGILGELDL